MRLLATCIALLFLLVAAPALAQDHSDFGYKTYDDSLTLLAHYTIRLDSRFGTPEQRIATEAAIQTTVSELNGIMGPNVTFDYGGITENPPQTDGAIAARDDMSGAPSTAWGFGQGTYAAKTTSSPCDPFRRPGTCFVTGGQIAVGNAIWTILWGMPAVVRHEMGHVIGLDHFDGAFHGRLQNMHTTFYSEAQSSYGDGDIAGLMAMAHKSAPATAHAPHVLHTSRACGANHPLRNCRASRAT